MAGNKSDYQYSPDTGNPLAMKYNQPKPNPNGQGEDRNIDNEWLMPTKTSGIEVRGTQSQTKGKMARGPMA